MRVRVLGGGLVSWVLEISDPEARFSGEFVA